MRDRVLPRLLAAETTLPKGLWIPRRWDRPVGPASNRSGVGFVLRRRLGLPRCLPPSSVLRPSPPPAPAPAFGGLGRRRRRRVRAVVAVAPLGPRAPAL